MCRIQEKCVLKKKIWKKSIKYLLDVNTADEVCVRENESALVPACVAWRKAVRKGFILSNEVIQRESLTLPEFGDGDFYWLVL